LISIAKNRLMISSRYWMHVLLKQEVVTEEHPCFSSWKDIGYNECMFTSKSAS
jgi:hypothetical protein